MSKVNIGRSNKILSSSYAGDQRRLCGPGQFRNTQPLVWAATGTHAPNACMPEHCCTCHSAAMWSSMARPHMQVMTEQEPPGFGIGPVRGP